MDQSDDSRKQPIRRDVLMAGTALLGSTLASGTTPDAHAQTGGGTPAPSSPPAALPEGYNILFILVDQEHFFPKWPFPVPARESIKRKAITFLNHQAASCVCSSARSVIYTGQHIQHTKISDDLNYVWQRDLSTSIKTIGARLSELGYYTSYQGKWHLSANLDQNSEAIDAPLKDYQRIIESYGFKDFFGVGDLIDGDRGGYSYDDMTASTAVTWLRTKAEALRAKGQPWYLAVNFVNPHDVMYFNSDLPAENIQGKSHKMPISRAPDDRLYQAIWDDHPLPASRHQSFDAPGRPKGQKLYQEVLDLLVGAWPDEDRRWRALRDYYFNCIRDCDRKVEAVLEALKNNGMDRNTIVIFTADHGELGGSHQMRGKGTSAYWQQNHLPLMVHHPAFPGGTECKAITSQLDLAPTIIGLTGKDAAAREKAAAGLKGRDFSMLLSNAGQADAHARRLAALYNFDMLSYQDRAWAAMVIDTKKFGEVTPEKQMAELEKHPPDFFNRTSIRSIWDGRYRFSRYFSPVRFNTPRSLEELLKNNDLEVYDRQEDPDEVYNLALDMKKNGDLIVALNDLANKTISAEVGIDDGSFLPIRNGKWHFPPSSKR